MSRLILQKKVAIFGSIGFFLISISLLFYNNIDKPYFSGVESVKIDSIQNGVYSGSANILITNDYFFSLSGDEINFQMFYKNKLVAEGNGNEEVVLESKSETPFNINFTFFIDSIDQNELENFLMNDSVQMQVVVSGKFTKLRVRVTEEMDTYIKCQELVDGIINNAFSDDGLKLKEVKFKDGGLSKTSLKVVFDFQNKIPTDVFLENIDFKIYAKSNQQNQVAKSIFNVDKLIPIDSTQQIEGVVDIDNVNAIMSTPTKIFNRKLDYYIKGFANIKLESNKIKIPVDQHIEFNPISRDIQILDK